MNSPPPNSPAAGAQRELWKVIAAAFVGTVIEWYDFFLYGTAAALVFNKLFFPTMDPLSGVMASFGTYAIGFFARPLGGILFGYIGDRYGRKITLVWTLSLMGFATFLVGCLPTYASVGVWAPVLLVALRFVQGIAVGGEWGGAALLTVEHGHRGNRGFYGSWTQAGVPMGLLLANGVFSLVRSGMELPEFLSWGWRAPFWFGIVLTVLGFVIRRYVHESPLFEIEAAKPKPAENPLLTVLRSNWRSVLLVIGARIAENASFYVFTVFVLSYATTQLGLSESMLLHGVLIGSALELLTIPLFGALSDRIGRRHVYLFGTLTLMGFAFPFFLMLATKNTFVIWAAISIALAIAHAAMYAPQAAFFSELFGTNVRFSGASLGYQLSSPLAGGLAPMIAAGLLKAAGGTPWTVATYLVVIGAISTIAVFFSLETSKRDITQ